MSFLKAKKNALTHSKEDPEDQKIQRELEAEASRLASLFEVLGDPKISKVLDAYSLYLDCFSLYSDASCAAIDLNMILLELFEIESSKEDGDTSLVLMTDKELRWVGVVTGKLNEVLAGVKAGTIPIADANELFIKAHEKFKERIGMFEHYVKS